MMSQTKFHSNRNINSILALMLLVLVNPIAVIAQTPTHIDPGHGDQDVSIMDNSGYLWIVIGFLILVAIIYILLRKRGNKNEEKTNY